MLRACFPTSSATGVRLSPSHALLGARATSRPDIVLQHLARRTLRNLLASIGHVGRIGHVYRMASVSRLLFSFEYNFQVVHPHNTSVVTCDDEVIFLAGGQLEMRDHSSGPVAKIETLQQPYALQVADRQPTLVVDGHKQCRGASKRTRLCGPLQWHKTAEPDSQARNQSARQDEVRNVRGPRTVSLMERNFVDQGRASLKVLALG
mmetsp:Transcript_83811/g.233785  ORF Transcript_83811/g.233785 Transcript_83811/m.233785 type:complete len:206 (-) Transcript_83811:359-976(-)